MKVVASTDDYTIYVRRDGRHAVIGTDKAPINGDDKVRILLEHGLITAAAPKEPEPEVAEEAVAEESASDEAAADDETPAEEEGSDDSSAEADGDDGAEDTEKAE